MSGSGKNATFQHSVTHQSERGRPAQRDAAALERENLPDPRNQSDRTKATSVVTEVKPQGRLQAQLSRVQSEGR